VARLLIVWLALFGLAAPVPASASEIVRVQVREPSEVVVERTDGRIRVIIEVLNEDGPRPPRPDPPDDDVPDPPRPTPQDPNPALIAAVAGELDRLRPEDQGVVARAAFDALDALERTTRNNPDMSIEALARWWRLHGFNELPDEPPDGAIETLNGLARIFEDEVEGSAIDRIKTLRKVFES